MNPLDRFTNEELEGLLQEATGTGEESRKIGAANAKLVLQLLATPGFKAYAQIALRAVNKQMQGFSHDEAWSQILMATLVLGARLGELAVLRPTVAKVGEA